MLFLVAAILVAQVETTYTVNYAGKKYEFRITDEDLQKTPAWPPGQENPPLSARRAMEIAAKQMATLLPNGKDWQLEAITLRRVDNRWIYVVQFLEPPRADGPDRQVSSGFQVVVLMNGVPVVPRVSP